MKTEKTSATLETVLSQYRVFRMSVWAVLALLIAALVCLFINRYAAFALLGQALVFHIFYVRRQQKAYTELVNRSNIELTVMKKIGAEDMSGKSTGGMSASTIKRSGMMPCDGSPSFFWGMEGDMGPFHLQISDVDVEAACCKQMLDKLLDEEIVFIDSYKGPALLGEDKDGMDAVLDKCPFCGAEIQIIPRDTKF